MLSLTKVTDKFVCMVLEFLWGIYEVTIVFSFDFNLILFDFNCLFNFYNMFFKILEFKCLQLFLEMHAANY